MQTTQRIESATLAGIRAVVPAWESALVATLDAILARFARTRDYPFIDTKLNAFTGADFAPGDDPERDFKSRRVLYTWIQGRGLEALAGHARWLPSCSVLTTDERRRRVEDVRTMAGKVAEAMESIRARNGGRLSFMMRPDGTPLQMADDGRVAPLPAIPPQSNFSDLFYAKGLFAVADLLERKDLAAEAKALFRRILADIERDSFVSDQQMFDPKNKVKPVPGRHSQGPRMIALGGLGLFYERSQEREWLAAGERFIQHLITKHVNRGQFIGLQPFDFVEHLDARGQPWMENGEVLSDTGHCLEFIGLALKLLLLMKAQLGAAAPEGLIWECEGLLPKLFVHNFALGFDAKHGGIRKAFGLVHRQPLNRDMPWWSLPETIRAAIELVAFCPRAEERGEILDVLAKCSNAFFAYFVNPNIHSMAYQTRNDKGKPVDVIPATPDLDPGYHTGLSIIDFLRLLPTLNG